MNRAARLSLGMLIAWSVTLHGEPVPVRYPEGLVHGFLVLRSLDGSKLADGDLIQRARGSRVTSRLVFHFKDGSLHDETVVYTQQRTFHLVSDHLVQKGASFPRALDLSIDGGTGRVVARYTGEHGGEEQAEEHIEVPADLANGLIPVLLKNVPPAGPPKMLSFIAATPKPRMVKLSISSAGRERFETGAESRAAVHYVLKVEIGGLSGRLAPLLGKQPPDSHVWILEGAAPAFVRAEQPFYVGGPVWRIDLASPAWRAP